MEGENKSRNPASVIIIQHKIIHDKQANVKRAEELIEAGIKLYNPDLVILPELFTTPTNLKNLENYIEDSENSETLNFLKTLAAKHKVYLIGGSIPIYFNGDKSKVYNTCFCLDRNGELKTTFRKIHLFDVDIPGKITYTESKKISPGDTCGVFETEFGKIGVGICYDIRFAEYALTLRKEHNIDMLVYPSAFNTVTGPLHWELLARSRAMDNQVFVAMASPSRNYENSSDYQAYGHSLIVDPFGQVVTSTGFEEDIVYAKLDLNKIDEVRNCIPVWKQKRWDLYGLNK